MFVNNEYAYLFIRAHQPLRYQWEEDKIYTELSWESLQSRRENKMIILYSDILHDRTPSYLKPIIPQTVKETSQGRYNLETTQI